jgi:hypothetical protein
VEDLVTDPCTGDIVQYPVGYVDTLVGGDYTFYSWDQVGFQTHTHVYILIYNCAHCQLLFFSASSQATYATSCKLYFLNIYNLIKYYSKIIA